MSTNSLLVKIAEERQLESEAVEEFMLNEDDRDERLKAHYRQGKIVDGKWVNDKEEEEERTEFEVEYGYMINKKKHSVACSEGYDDEKDAKEYYDMLVSNKEYDYVWLVMRHMEGEDCVCSETIEEWNK